MICKPNFDAIVAANIKRLRKEKKISQVKLGKLIGVSGASVSYVENGITALSFYKAAHLARCLNIYLEELLEE